MDNLRRWFLWVGSFYFLMALLNLYFVLVAPDLLGLFGQLPFP
jgi:hypothetical protein